MASTINTNVTALNAQRNFSATQSSMSTTMQRLSSGLRVNSAKDDAAGLAIAERMNAQIKGMNVAVRNANDAISYSQTAEGALSKMGDNLQRMRELAVQSRNATNSSGDRANLQKEFTQLQDELKRTIDGSKFNNQAIFASSASATLEFQVGAGTDAATDIIKVSNAVMGGGTAAAASSVSSTTEVDDLMATVYTTMGTGTTGLSISGTAGDVGNIDSAINAIDAALDKVNGTRADFGAAQNRFDAVISSLQVNIENQSAARGRIVDADFAAETANLSRSQILQQAGTAMIAQANQLPQSVLQLLR